MASKIRIGEVLLMRESVEPEVLSQALRNPLTVPQRLISQLMIRAQLDPEEAALVLAEHTGYPAAMERHLEDRNPEVRDLIPRELIQGWCVVPLGWAPDGRLITLARDPTPILAAALEHAAQTRVTLAVAPAVQIERLMRSVYGVEPAGTHAHPPVARPAFADIGEIKLSEEAERQRGRTISQKFQLDDRPELPRSRQPSSHRPLEVTLAELERAITVAAAERSAMIFAQSRWLTALLLQVTGTEVIGVRGHGAQLAQPTRIVFPLGAPSTLQRALDGRVATTDAPDSLFQRRLRHLLGELRTPVAAPIQIGDRVVGAVVVGATTPDVASSIADLGRLVDGLSDAHERLMRHPR